METNPYKKGTDEYLDFATKQHDKATGKVKTKPKTKVIEHKGPSLAGDDKIAQAMANAKQQQKIGGNLIGAAMASLAGQK